MKRQVSICTNESNSAPSDIFFMSDVLVKIQSTLDFRSYLALKCVCRYIYARNTSSGTRVFRRISGDKLYQQASERDALARITTHLQHIGILEGCERFLSRYSAVIAGGYALMHLHNAYWQGHDIDIFLPSLTREQERTLSDDIKQDFPTISLQYPETSAEPAEYISDANDESSARAVNACIYVKRTVLPITRRVFKKPCIDTFDDFEKMHETLSLQFILTPHANVVDYVRTRFDLSFCKVYTDLKSLHCEFFLDAMRKVGYIHNGFDMKQFSERAHKYKSRGFKILTPSVPASESVSELKD